MSEDYRNINFVEVSDDFDPLKFKWCQEHGIDDYQECLKYIEKMEDEHDDWDDPWDDDDDDELDDEDIAIIAGVSAAVLVVIGLIIFLIVAKVKKCLCFKPKVKETKEELKDEIVSSSGLVSESDGKNTKTKKGGDKEQAKLIAPEKVNVVQPAEQIQYPSFNTQSTYQTQQQQQQGYPSNQLLLLDFARLNNANPGQQVAPTMQYPDVPVIMVPTPTTVPQMAQIPLQQNPSQIYISNGM